MMADWHGVKYWSRVIQMIGTKCSWEALVPCSDIAKFAKSFAKVENFLTSDVCHGHSMKWSIDNIVFFLPARLVAIKHRMEDWLSTLRPGLIARLATRITRGNQGDEGDHQRNIHVEHKLAERKGK